MASTPRAWPSCTTAPRGPPTTHPAFPPAAAEALRDLLHRRPRALGKPTSRWTRERAAEVSCAVGLSATVVTGEALRQTLRRLGSRWKRAKQWITSPDPESLRTKGGATA